MKAARKRKPKKKTSNKKEEKEKNLNFVIAKQIGRKTQQKKMLYKAVQKG